MVIMSKINLGGKSDYAKLKEELELYKSRYITMDDIMFNLKRINSKARKLDQAEKVLNKVLDLINSNEDLVHFQTTKNELRKPIEEYFKKVK